MNSLLGWVYRGVAPVMPVLLTSGWAGMVPIDGGDDCLVVGELSQQALFQRAQKGPGRRNPSPSHGRDHPSRRGGRGRPTAHQVSPTAARHRVSQTRSSLPKGDPFAFRMTSASLSQFRKAPPCN